MSGRRAQRVVYVNPTDELGGADASLFEIVRCLDRERFEPHVVLPHAGPYTARYRELGVAVHHVPVLKLRNTHDPRRHLAWLCRAPARVRRLRILFDRLQPRLIQVNTSVDVLAAFAAWRHGRRVRCPLVWYVREAVLEPAWVGRAIDAMIARFADAVVAVSAPVAARFAHHRRCRVVQSGIDLEALAPPREVRERSAVLGWLGRLAPGKGVENVISVFESLHAQRPQSRLVIVAAELAEHREYAERVRGRVRGSRAASAIEWRGATGEPSGSYRAMDLFVHLPDRPEGLGRTVLEAQASGTPVLTWPHGGLRDALEDGVGGRLAPVGDLGAATALAGAMLDDPELGALAERGRERVCNGFGAPAAAAALASLYAEVTQ